MVVRAMLYIIPSECLDSDMPDVHRQFVVYPDRNVVFHAADTESDVLPNYVPMIRPDDVKPRTGNLLKHFSIDKGTRKTDRCHLLNSLTPTQVKVEEETSEEEANLLELKRKQLDLLLKRN